MLNLLFIWIGIHPNINDIVSLVKLETRNIASYSSYTTNIPELTVGSVEHTLFMSITP